jgi:hypothetical protein
VSVLALSEAVLFRGMWARELMGNAMCGEKLFEIVACEFSTVVSAQCLDF